jgi:hypothetical protein
VLLFRANFQGRWPRDIAINLKDDQGQTALMKARAKSHERVVELLNEAEAQSRPKYKK